MNHDLSLLPQELNREKWEWHLTRLWSEDQSLAWVSEDKDGEVATAGQRAHMRSGGRCTTAHSSSQQPHLLGSDWREGAGSVARDEAGRSDALPWEGRRAFKVSR